MENENMVNNNPNVVNENSNNTNPNNIVPTEKKRNKTLLVVILILIVLVALGAVYIFLFRGNDSSSETNTITQNETTPTDDKTVTTLKDNEVFSTEVKEISLNGNTATLSLKYYVINDTEVEDYKLYYDVYLNNKVVTNGVQNEIYYDACDYVDGEEYCDITAQRLTAFTKRIKSLATIVDNNKKEYIVVEIDRGPLGEYDVLIINDQNELLLYMDSGNLNGGGELLGTGEETYLFNEPGSSYKSFHTYVIKNNKISYLKINESESIESKIKYNEHIITIKNGKINDVTTGNKITLNLISGGSPDGASVKVY